MDNITIIRQMQLEKVKGELRALLVSYYDPTQGRTTTYTENQILIEGIIKDLDMQMG